MGCPSLSFLLPRHTGEGNAPPCTPPLRGGGELEAAAAPEAAGHHCRTRRPRLPLVRHRPFGPGCGRSSYWQSGGPLASAASAEARAALPERPTQTGSGCPPRWGTPAIAAPRGHQAVTLPPQPAPQAWPPLPGSDGPAGGTGCPGTPPTTGPPRSSGPGVSARSLPAPPAGGTRSLTGSRRCPRSMAPGTAAAPAPGCWPRLLRPAADGGALRKLRR